MRKAVGIVVGVLLFVFALIGAISAIGSDDFDNGIDRLDPRSESEHGDVLPASTSATVGTAVPPAPVAYDTAVAFVDQYLLAAGRDGGTGEAWNMLSPNDQADYDGSDGSGGREAFDDFWVSVVLVDPQNSYRSAGSDPATGDAIVDVDLRYVYDDGEGLTHEEVDDARFVVGQRDGRLLIIDYDPARES